MSKTWIRRFSKTAQIAILGASLVGLSACGSSEKTESSSKVDANALTLEEITKKAKKEGAINSVGMPDSWANWKETWEEISAKYGLKHTDTDMSSAEEIAKMEAEKENATADIGDVGIAFAPVAEKKGITLQYKTSYWDEIPSWAKDDNGDWVVGYQGTIAFLTNKERVHNPPKSWGDLLKGDYKVQVGDVQRAAQSQMAVLAAAIGHGGDEGNIQPGVDFFAKLAKQGRLQQSSTDILPLLEKGEVDVAILWDFNAIGYAEKIDRSRFDITIPKEGSVVSGYATIINKYAKHPYAAMLTREYILSDEGQINLAKGYARPIRDVKLPKEVAAKLIPNEQYKNAKPIKDYSIWEQTAKELPRKWQEEVQIYVK